MNKGSLVGKVHLDSTKFLKKFLTKRFKKLCSYKMSPMWITDFI